MTVTRRKDFDKPVNLAVILAHLGGVHGNPLPPGVTVAESGNKTLLGPTETAGKIVLEASADAAPCENVPIAVMGHVSINFVVKTAYASKPILVSVVPKDRDGSSDRTRRRQQVTDDSSRSGISRSWRSKRLNGLRAGSAGATAIESAEPARGGRGRACCRDRVPAGRRTNRARCRPRVGRRAPWSAT